MPNLALGSPNAKISKMRPEPMSFNNRFAVLGDDASSTAAVAEDDPSYWDEDEGKKKRYVTRKENSGATKKIKLEWAGKRNHTSSQPQLPDMFLRMRDDANYERIMKEEFKKLEGVEFDLSAEKKMGKDILQKLLRDYHLCSSDGSSLEDSVALQSKIRCFGFRFKYFIFRLTSNLLLSLALHRNQAVPS